MYLKRIETFIKQAGAVIGLAALCLSFSIQLARAEAYSSYIVEEKADETVIGGEVSIEALEKSLASPSMNDYSRSTTLRNIARLYMVEKNWSKAAETFREAMETQGLSEITQQQMLYQLTQVLTQVKDYQGVVTECERWFARGIEPTAKLYLTLAGAYGEVSKPKEALNAVSKARKLSVGFNSVSYKHFLKIYYKLARYDLAAEIVRARLNENVEDEEAWSLLSSIYIAAKDHRGALSTLEIAHRKGLLQEKETLFRLAQLYQFNKLPIKSARILEESLNRGLIEADEQFYDALYQAWDAAKEWERAKIALSQVAKMKKDGLLYLRLAQMQIELEEWDGAIESTFQACDNGLQKRHFGKAFLFRGIAQFNNKKIKRSKRSFISATQIGTEREAAAKWLRFIGGDSSASRERYAEISSCS